MSYTYNSTSVDAHSSPELVDDFGQPLPENTLLSPYNPSQTLSNSASPSYNINSTPGESLSDYSNYQPSEFSEVDDPFFGVDFDAGVHRIDSLQSALAGQARHAAQTSSQPVEAPQPQPEITAPSEPRSASSTYPLSPIHSSIPNTPSPRVASNELKNKTTISQYELSDLHNTGYRAAESQPPKNPSTIQLTPDHSGSSHTSAEGFEPSNMMNHREQSSPRISISQWESMNPQQSDYFIPGRDNTTNANDSSLGNQPQNQIDRGEDGSWRSNEVTGQAGLDPVSRQAVSGVEMPSLKEQEKQQEIDRAISGVEEWQSRAVSSNVIEDELPTQSYFPASNQLWNEQNMVHRHPPSDDDNDIAPVDDAASIRENKLIGGQVYYNIRNAVPTEIDFQLMQQSRHWSDAPAVPEITRTNFQQPPTSNDAIARWHRSADNFSLASRAATWGTRRRSEPSVADWESVADGSFLKKLSITKPKEGTRSRNNSIFDQGLHRLASFTRKRSDSRLKRSRSAVNVQDDDITSQDPRKNSQDTLAPPPRTSSFGPKPTPSLNTALAGMAGTIAAVGTTHARSGSVSNTTTSPKSPLHLGGLRSVIKRARSKSELTAQDKAAQTGLAGLWRGTGGPPVPNLSSAQVSAQADAEARQPENQGRDIDEDEDDDDELADEGDMKVDMEEETDPIIPNYEGFKAHVRRLNPDMDRQYNWLVSRIAHQQEIRYKSLLELRVKHSQAVATRQCQAGHHCVALGGNATLLDGKGNPRDSERNTTGLQLVTDFSDDSNPGEGALTDETFPQGVPKPPTRNLPAEFECQLCFKAKKFQKPSDWTKHVHEDVQPFTCTYDKCKEPKSFKRKADWVRHENERHRHLEWWVCQVEDCRHPCYRKDNFLQHLVREHKLPEPKQKTKAAIKKARTTEQAWIMLERCHHETQNRPQDEPCKFCGKTFATWKKLTVHLAKHMEHISLPILRLVEARDVDANTIISPVEQQILTPITPIGRAKMENSPFNMNNISPHGAMGQQYSSSGFNQHSYYQAAATAPPSQYSQPQMPEQHMNYNNQNVYANDFNVQSMEQTRGFSAIGQNSFSHVNQARNFGSMDSSFPQVKIEQPRPFGSMDASFSHVNPGSNFNAIPQNGYSMPQNFSAAPAVSGYPSSNMQGVSDGGFDFDPMTIAGGQNFQQQVPMNRSHGSASSYGQHSPQNMTPYYGGHQ